MLTKLKKRSVVGLLLLIIGCMAGLMGCEQEEAQGTAVKISYLNKGETKITAEEHYLEGTTTKEMIVEVLTLLGAVPENKELKATISGGITIINYSLEGEQVTVSLGEKYKELSKTTEVLTRAAIVRSLTEIPGVEYVMLTVNGEPFTDLAGNALGIMTDDTFIDSAAEQMDTYEKVTIRLYFANEAGDGLLAINRELVHNINISNVSMEKLVVEQLIAGPANEESWPTINAGTKLLGVTVQDGVCYVNFDSAFLSSVNNVTSDVTIYSIVNSLVELSNINKVQILVDGNKEVKFRDKFDLTSIFERNLQLVQ